MNLYILRHGIAAEKEEWKGADADRPLTKEGVRKMKKAAKGMRRLGIHIEWILTSPYRRAYDTALILAKEFKLKKSMKVSKMLAPDGDSKALVRYLGQNFRSWESVVLVGHDPYLSSLLGLLAAGTPSAGITLDKGGLAKLSADSLTYGACARLDWLLSPKILKNIN